MSLSHLELQYKRLFQKQMRLDTTSVDQHNTVVGQISHGCMYRSVNHISAFASR